MIENIKERIQAEETAFGKFLIKYIGLGGILFTAIGESMIYLNAIPADWLPLWLRQAIPLCAVIGGVIGKLTKKA